MPAQFARMRVAVVASLLAVGAALPARAAAQTIDGILVVGEARSAVAGARVFLLNRFQESIDTASTDVFGAFKLEASKPGRYFIQVRRKGYYPILTERFELQEEETRTDTVVLQGKVAEQSVKNVVEDNVQRLFGSSVGAAFSRWLGPDEMEALRGEAFSLGDVVQRGRMLGVQWLNPPSGCLRFSGASGCAQLYVDGLAVFMRPDQVNASDIEAVIALRATEIGTSTTGGGPLDNSRFGAVLVYTSRFNGR